MQNQKLKRCALFLNIAAVAVTVSLFSCTKETDIAEPSTTLKAVSTSQSLAVNSISITSSPMSNLSGQNLMLGINGHMGDAPYLKTSLTKQIQLLKERGMGWYRINVQTQSDGSASASALLESLQVAASAQGVKILPMLYLNTLNFNKSESENYQLGKTLGGNFAAKYGKYFTVYDLGNDLELPLLLANKTGTSSSHYDNRKTNLTAAYLKGMDEGIKAKDAGAKTMIDAGWLHYGFLQMCASYGVKFDAIGYHWYSDMENAAPNSPTNIPDITIKLAGLFPTKQLWFTEFGYRYKSSLSITANEAAQTKFVTSFVAKCKANPAVKVVCAYELFDEPYKKGQESSYGIIKWTNQYSQMADKDISKLLITKAIK
jgi:hypothetical protein